MLGRMVWGFPGNHACHGHFHGLRRGAFLHDGFAAIEGNYENVLGAGSSLGGGVNESEGGEKDTRGHGELGESGFCSPHAPEHNQKGKGIRFHADLPRLRTIA